MLARYSSLALLIVAGILAPGLALTSCGAREAREVQSITIGVPPLEQNALLYVAEAQKLFESNGLRVTFRDYDTGVATANALLAGQVDIAEMAEFPFVKPVLEKQPLRIIAVNDRFENGYLLVRKDRGITDETDLSGNRIGVIRGTILEFYLGRFLQLHGIPIQDVTIVDTATTSQTIAAIVDGEIDAVVAFQPYAASIQGLLGDEVMTWPVQNAQLVYGLLVGNADWLAQNSDTVERLLQALAKAEDYICTHPDQARAIIQKRLNLDADYVDSIWPLHQFSLSLDFSLIIAMNDEARWMMGNHLVGENSVPDFRDYIYLEGLQAVRPEAVSISP
jgi:ABC-type nitrate/sulfonate/bicarbonate transport system substrate-binding protein